MKIPWAKIAHIGVEMVGSVVPAVYTIEQMAGKVGGVAGGDKQHAVVDLVQMQLSSAFAHFDTTLLFNPRVVAAIRVVIDSIVALQQTIANELHAAGKLTEAGQPTTPTL